MSACMVMGELGKQCKPSTRQNLQPLCWSSMSESYLSVNQHVRELGRLAHDCSRVHQPAQSQALGGETDPAPFIATADQSCNVNTHINTSRQLRQFAYWKSCHGASLLRSTYLNYLPYLLPNAISPMLTEALLSARLVATQCYAHTALLPSPCAQCSVNGAQCLAPCAGSCLREHPAGKDAKCGCHVHARTCQWLPPRLILNHVARCCCCIDGACLLQGPARPPAWPCGHPAVCCLQPLGPKWRAPSPALAPRSRFRHR